MEVILRNNLVESVRAGDKVVFVGNLIVVPDVAVISAPGERVTAAAPGGMALSQLLLLVGLLSHSSCSW